MAKLLQLDAATWYDTRWTCRCTFSGAERAIEARAIAIRATSELGRIHVVESLHSARIAGGDCDDAQAYIAPNDRWRRWIFMDYPQCEAGIEKT